MKVSELRYYVLDYEQYYPSIAVWDTYEEALANANEMDTVEIVEGRVVKEMKEAPRREPKEGGIQLINVTGEIKTRPIRERNGVIEVSYESE